VITIATYNIQYGIGLDGRFDLARIVEVIGNIDIVALQEVETNWERSGNRNIPAQLQEMMPDHYAAWGPNIDVLKTHDPLGSSPRARRQFGNMIFSRFPILSIRNHLLPRYGAATQLDMQRGALEATIAMPGGSVRVYCTHLCHLSEDQRCRQLERLVEIVHAAPFEGPPLSGSHDRDLSWSSEPPLTAVPADAIILGDFNCTPDGSAYAVLAGEGSERRGRMARLGHFVDAWDAARERKGLLSGATHDGATRYTDNPPQPGKGRRVDFCFLPLRFEHRVASAHVLADAVGSDHLPLIVELEQA
jgi:endonuclease/exonuclease/phosphatase family metal-dependent hydrolase